MKHKVIDIGVQNVSYDSIDSIIEGRKVRQAAEEKEKLRGIDGIKGEQGIQGIRGEKGDKGDKGDQGIKGDKGDKGDKGEKGDKGTRGERGYRGKEGSRGEKGDPGRDGRDGIDGINGKDGKDGKTIVREVGVSLGGYVAVKDPIGKAEGDTLYYDGVNWDNLAIGTAGQVFQSNGTVPNWATLDISTDITGTLPILNGGTGESTANAAFNALAPSQTGNAGKFLKSDASNTSWQDITESDLTLSDVTTNNATTSAHGFLPKLSGNSNQYLDGNGNYSTPAGIVSSYTSVTFLAQSSITVNHNFGAVPVVNIIDGLGNVREPNNIQHTSINSFTVTFTASTSGTIIASVGSPQARNLRTVSGSDTTTDDDGYIAATGAESTITLHATSVDGLEITIDNRTDGSIFVDTNVGTLRGETSQTIPPQSRVDFTYIGTEWSF